MMKKILYIDDNPAKISELKDNFCEFEVISFDNPLKASYEIEYIDYDILLLDIIMPFVDGFKLYEKAIEKRNYCGQPVFFISETIDETHMLEALKRGTGELLTPDMPWAIKKQRILNRLQGQNCRNEKSQCLSFNFAKSEVSKDNVKISLTNKEILLLQYVSSNGSVPQSCLISYVWAENSSMAKNNIATHLTNLNKKIKCFGIRASSRQGQVSIIQLT